MTPTQATSSSISSKDSNNHSFRRRRRESVEVSIVGFRGRRRKDAARGYQHLSSSSHGLRAEFERKANSSPRTGTASNRPSEGSENLWALNRCCRFRIPLQLRWKKCLARRERETEIAKPYPRTEASGRLYRVIRLLLHLLILTLFSQNWRSKWENIRD